MMDRGRKKSLSFSQISKQHQINSHILRSNNNTYMTITETSYTIAPSAPPEDSRTDYPIVGAVPIYNDEPRQQKVSTATPVVHARPTTTSTTVTHIPATTQSTTSHPPPGVPDGGIWGSVRHTGGGTWALCGILSVVGCMVFLFPCGIFALCCPCDEKDAYLVNRKVYDHNGKFLGNVNRFHFRRRQ
jgi:hypothetical protein